MSTFDEKCNACTKKRIDKACENVLVQCQYGCSFRFHIQCWEKKVFKKGGSFEMTKKEKFKPNAICESSLHKTHGKSRIVRAQLWQNGLLTKTYFDLEEVPSAIPNVDSELLEAAKKLFFETVLSDLAKIWRKKSGRDSRIFFDGHYTLRKLGLARQGGKESLFYWTSLEERWQNLNPHQQQQYISQARAEVRDKEKKREKATRAIGPPTSSPGNKKRGLKKKVAAAPKPKPKLDWIYDNSEATDAIAQRYIRSAPRSTFRQYGQPSYSSFIEAEATTEIERKHVVKPSDLSDKQEFPGLKRSSKKPPQVEQLEQDRKQHSRKKEIHGTVVNNAGVWRTSNGSPDWTAASVQQQPGLSPRSMSNYKDHNDFATEPSWSLSMGQNLPIRAESTLPSPWEAVKCPDTGETYYWNTITDQTSWDRPSSGSQGRQPEYSPEQRSVYQPIGNEVSSAEIGSAGSPYSDRNAKSSGNGKKVVQLKEDLLLARNKIHQQELLIGEQKKMIQEGEQTTKQLMDELDRLTMENRNLRVELSGSHGAFTKRM